MRLRLTFGAAVLSTGVWLAVAGPAAAQEATDPPPVTSPQPTAAPTAAPTPAPTPAPTAPPAAETPVPTAVAQGPQITPWPWPFPWMQEELDRRAAQEETAAEGSAVSVQGPSAVSAPVDGSSADAPTLGTSRTAAGPGSLSHGVAADGETGETDAGQAADGQGGRLPGRAPTPGQTVPDAVITSSASTQQICEYHAVSNDLSGPTGFILQTSVRYEDCTWGGAQVLFSYEIRGPPTVDLLAQSSKVNVDIEAYVAKTGVNVDVALVGPNGAPLQAASSVPSGQQASGPAPLGSHGSDMSSQQGDNQVDVTQDTGSATGDVSSGTQRVRLFVEGDADRIRVLAQNGSPDSLAVTGDAVSSNDVAADAGGIAAGDGALAGQMGDNEVELDQTARARSGHALAGSQDIGIYATGSVKELSVLANNASPNAMATSGNATAANDATGVAGPGAVSGEGTAMAGQIGDNRVDLDQDASATTGDAVAGSQVIDIVIGGSLGELAILATNDASGASAISGDAIAANAGQALAGPYATAADGNAMSSQMGDNDVTVGQSAAATSGRALTGSQAISVTVGGTIGNAAIQPLNSADDTVARSGSAQASNEAGGSVGPRTEASGTASSMQSGDNQVTVDQHHEPSSGDSAAGGQVVGVVSGAGPSATTQAVEGRLSMAA